MASHRKKAKTMHNPTFVLLACCVLFATACGGAGDDDGAADAPEEITWSKHIAPLVTERCVGCHNDHGIAPFSMEHYDSAKPWASAMVLATAAGTMPPFLAQDTDECVPRYTWKDDLRLSSQEKALLRKWAEASAPEGDPDTAAKLPPRVALTLEDPDVQLKIPSAVTIDGSRDEFWCFVIDTKLAEDRWFNEMQINAGNAKIVHHVLVYNDEGMALDDERASAGKYECFGGVAVAGSRMINAWAPGAIPFKTPDDVAFELKAGARLIVQVHYHPTGGKEVDADTGIDMKYAPGKPKYRTAVTLIGNFQSPVLAGGLLPGDDDPEGVIEFKIPAGAKNHSETMTNTVTATEDQLIWGMGTHMHYVGRSMTVHLERAAPKKGEPTRECLIHTPEWNFNWQRGYSYDAPLDQVPVARAGDKFLFRCDYDNSMDNPFVVAALKQQGLSAPQDVYLGETTLDEMCLGAFAIATKITE